MGTCAGRRTPRATRAPAAGPSRRTSSYARVARAEDPPPPHRCVFIGCKEGYRGEEREREGERGREREKEWRRRGEGAKVLRSRRGRSTRTLGGAVSAMAMGSARARVPRPRVAAPLVRRVRHHRSPLLPRGVGRGRPLTVRVLLRLHRSDQPHRARTAERHAVLNVQVGAISAFVHGGVQVLVPRLSQSISVESRGILQVLRICRPHVLIEEANLVHHLLAQGVRRPYGLKGTPLVPSLWAGGRAGGLGRADQVRAISECGAGRRHGPAAAGVSR